MIVDDDPDICVTLRQIFKQNGFIADSFTDPILALGIFKTCLYDLLLLDIKMSQMDGFQLYEEMKKIDNEVKVCFLTAGEHFGMSRKEKEFYRIEVEYPFELIQGSHFDTCTSVILDPAQNDPRANFQEYP